MGKKETEEGLSQQNTYKILSVARMDLRTDEVEEKLPFLSRWITEYLPLGIDEIGENKRWTSNRIT